jgi:hypothetical protein
MSVPWLGWLERAGLLPGSQIRLEPFQEPGSSPAKPRIPLADPHESTNEVSEREPGRRRSGGHPRSA